MSPMTTKSAVDDLPTRMAHPNWPQSSDESRCIVSASILPLDPTVDTRPVASKPALRLSAKFRASEALIPLP